MANSDTLRPQPRHTLSSAIRYYRDVIKASRDNTNAGLSPQSTTRSYGTTSRNPTFPTNSSDAVQAAERQHLLHPQPPRLGERDSNDGPNTQATGDSDHHDEEALQFEQADSDGLYPPNCTWTGDVDAPARADPFNTSDCAVFIRTQEIRKIVIECIDDPYSLEQLKAPKMNMSLVRPLVDKFYNIQDLSIVYCLLINRTQFIREQSYATHHQSVNLTRALLCELLAEKVLRRYNEANPGPLGLLKLANILVAGFEPFQGAPDEIVKYSGSVESRSQQRKPRPHSQRMTALEVAIVSESKSFLASSACQKVVDAIYHGKIVYSPGSFIDIIPDTWKRRPISLYDPRRAPLLNQYRLIVPRTRNLIEVVQFIILLVLYLIVLTGREEWRTTKYEPMEAVFDVYAAGWVLDQIASILEHGWHVYTQNLWSFLDVIFMSQFVLYLSLRFHGFRADHETDHDNQPFGRAALDVLSCAAPILVPRLAFNIMSDNMLFLSLRAMINDFLVLTALAVWCFGGFLLSLKWLHDGMHEPETIGKWMIWIWFGLDGTGIDQAPDFHWLLGPALMICFAFLGNFFLTLLVAMLSNTFSSITANAVSEIQYRRSVLTFMGVKSDAIFAFQPPSNLLAFCFLLPLKFVLSPRAFHKVNVACVKLLNMPLLVVISLYERRVLWKSERYRNLRPSRIDWRSPNGPRVLGISWYSRAFGLWDFSRFSAHGDIQAVFDAEPRGNQQNSQTEDQRPGINIVDDAPIQSAVLESPASSPGLAAAPGPSNESGALGSTRKRSLRLSSHHRSSQRLSVSRDVTPNSAYPATLKRWISRDRKDSISDFDGTHGGQHETNARLIMLEQGVERIESLLEQLLNDGGEQKPDDQE